MGEVPLYFACKMFYGASDCPQATALWRFSLLFLVGFQVSHHKPA
jgi:hypothetical protein